MSTYPVAWVAQLGDALDTRTATVSRSRADELREAGMTVTPAFAEARVWVLFKVNASAYPSGTYDVVAVVSGDNAAAVRACDRLLGDAVMAENVKRKLRDEDEDPVEFDAGRIVDPSSWPGHPTFAWQSYDVLPADAVGLGEAI